jgi:hypothetical protein
MKIIFAIILNVLVLSDVMPDSSNLNNNAYYPVKNSPSQIQMFSQAHKVSQIVFDQSTFK